jgi:hypothetical protein
LEKAETSIVGSMLTLRLAERKCFIPAQNWAAAHAFDPGKIV